MRVIRSVLLGTHRDLDTISGCTERRGVALVDDNTKSTNSTCGVTGVGDARNRCAGSTSLRLDTEGLVTEQSVSDKFCKPFNEAYLLVIVFPVIVISETVASDEIEPMEIPWPPIQVLRWKTMLLPLLMARQSSWL